MSSDPAGMPAQPSGLPPDLLVFATAHPKGLDRRRLRRMLLERYPWLGSTEVGPQTVEAGECDRCHHRPRVVATCGPVAWTALCRDCGVEVGLDAWCDGHVDAARHHLAWAESLPSEWDDAVRLWWVATGEVRVRPPGPRSEDADAGRPPP